MDKKAILRLLKKYRHLLQNYLQLTNDTHKLLNVIKQLREALEHPLNELKQYMAMNDKDRYTVDILQNKYGYHPQNFKKLNEELKSAKKHLQRIENDLTTHANTIEPIQNQIENDVEKLNVAESKLAAVTLAPGAFDLIEDQFVEREHNLTHNCHALKHNIGGILNIHNYLPHVLGPVLDWMFAFSKIEEVQAKAELLKAAEALTSSLQNLQNQLTVLQKQELHLTHEMNHILLDVKAQNVLAAQEITAETTLDNIMAETRKSSLPTPSPVPSGADADPDEDK